MSVASFIPELWDAAIKEPYQKSLIFGQPTVASNAWMGQISNVGDTVHISAIGAPTIRKYERGTALVTEDVNVSTTTLNIDQGSYFSFNVNDVDKVQAAGDFQGPATNSAGIALRDAADKYLAGVLTGGVLTANKIGKVDVISDDPSRLTTGDSAFQVLVQLATKLNLQSVPTAGRYVIVGAATYAALLMDPRFTRVDASGSEDGLRNGIVGRAIGFDVLVSNNVPTKAGAETIVAGVPDAFAFADQIVETEALRSQTDFGDIVRGLNVYGAAVTRPEGLASAEVTVKNPAPAGAGE
ncbi:hypothetical protein [Corynebacterium variabile]|uniref:hypothetical protein n=1 Tax=Corynebacterium variabile TaxID=1727 RepID=UPI002897F652|nr:hypothetical protein [Corynebacterium variabile]